MNTNKFLVALLATTLLTACSLAPKYGVPETESAAAYKELDGKWQVASKDAGLIDASDWWTLFQDDALNALEKQAAESSQTLKIAAAQLEQSRAIYRQARSSFLPDINLGGNASRADTASTGSKPTNSFSVEGNVSYEVDLFGRVRDTVAASKSDAKAAQALYGQVLLAIQADVAQYYFTLLTLDTERDVLRQTIGLREEAAKLLEARYNEGEVNEQDFLQAQTDLSSTRASLSGLDETRSLTEHALAVLVGRSPSNFNFVEKKLPEILPIIPAGLPSQLLERRPDIAAAQFKMAAANARIGVARAAFFPSLNLTASGGLASNELSDIFKWSSRSWALGPLFGTALSMPLFDGGRRLAGVDLAHAGYDEAVANYRQQVLVSFREVEDSLSSLRLKSEQAKHLFDAASTAGKAARLSNLRYREGESDYLEVTQTQRDELGAQRAYSQTQGARFIATVTLIRALGGGWAASGNPQ